MKITLRMRRSDEDSPSFEKKRRRLPFLCEEVMKAPLFMRTSDGDSISYLKKSLTPCSKCAAKSELNRNSTDDGHRSKTSIIDEEVDVIDLMVSDDNILLSSKY